MTSANENDQILSGTFLHRVFGASLVLKGLFALAELASGLALYSVGTDLILNFAQWATLEELTEDPADFIATTLLHLAQDFSIEAKAFYSFYLASHGIVKIVIVLALWQRVKWAYPLAAMVMLLFVAYQLYRFSYTGSWGLLALSGFDLFVITLIWREYGAMKRG